MLLYNNRIGNRFLKLLDQEINNFKFNPLAAVGSGQSIKLYNNRTFNVNNPCGGDKMIVKFVWSFSRNTVFQESWNTRIVDLSMVS